MTSALLETCTYTKNLVTQRRQASAISHFSNGNNTIAGSKAITCAVQLKSICSTLITYPRVNNTGIITNAFLIIEMRDSTRVSFRATIRLCFSIILLSIEFAHSICTSPSMYIIVRITISLLSALFTSSRPLWMNSLNPPGIIFSWEAYGRIP